jgi:hypothetical protein
MIKALFRWSWRRRPQPVVERTLEQQLIICRRINPDGTYEVEIRA